MKRVNFRGIVFLCELCLVLAMVGCDKPVIEPSAEGEAPAASEGQAITEGEAPVPTPPAAPAPPSLFPGAKEIVLRWRANTESDLKGYKVYRDGVSLTPAPIKTTTYKDSSGAANTSYAYTLSAVDMDATESAKSAAVTTTFGAVLLWTPDVVKGMGTTARVPVNITNAAGLQASGMTMTLTYGTTLATSVRVLPTAITSDVQLAANTATPGTVQITATSASQTLLGQGALCALEFALVNEANRSESVTITAANMRDEVGAAVPVAFEAAGSLLQTNNCSATDNLHEMGDVEDDCEVNEGDVDLALDFCVGKTLPVDWQLICGDLNGDSMLDPADAVMIKRAVKLLALSPEKRLDLPGQVRARAGQVEAAAGTEVDVPITTTDATGLASVSFTLAFGANLEYIATLAGSLTNGFIVHTQPGVGYVNVSIVGDTPVPYGAGTVAVVRFRVKPDAPASTVIPVRINGLTLTGAYGQNFDWYGDVALEDGGVTVAAPQQATLNLSVVGHGTVSPGAGAHKYDIGSQVTLTAAAAASDIYTTLARWEGDVTGTANPITVTMDSDKDVTAVFSTQSGGGGTQATFAGIAFRWCPAGTFTMGSPTLEVGRNTDEVEHQVTLTKGFWMSETEVTQAQWVAVMGSNPSYFTGDTSRPVEQVSWDDICTATTGYLAKLNAANPGNGFRLPTEAEWEYAYRAGTTQRFYWGDDPSYTLIGNYAWYSNNSSNTTHSVGTKTANAWGLKDMSGNVWEWCGDWYGSYASGAVTDPTGLGTGSIRVVRGGGCYYNDNCRAADRGSGDPGSTYVDIGLRLAR